MGISKELVKHLVVLGVLTVGIGVLIYLDRREKKKLEALAAEDEPCDDVDDWEAASSPDDSWNDDVVEEGGSPFNNELAGLADLRDNGYFEEGDR